MMDSCIYDILDQCYHNCENCPRTETEEPDWDLIRDLEKERDDE